MITKRTGQAIYRRRLHAYLQLTGLLCAVWTASAQDVNWSVDQYSVLGTDSTQFENSFTPTDFTADNYDADLYERPISSGFDEYYNYVDIKYTYVGLDNEWFYYAIELVGTKGGDLEGQYGFEVDFDGDNRGDFYFFLTDAKSSDVQSVSWTSKTVQAWEDADGDIGGLDPFVGEGNFGSNGFETEREKEGSNVRARIGRDSNGNAIDNIIEIAVRQSFVGNPATAGSLRGWASKGGQSHQNMLWNDNYTINDLGSLQLGYISNFYEGDNSGGVGSGLTLILIGVDVTANDTAEEGDAGTTVDYPYTIANDADGGTDTINITATSSNGWQIELYDSAGTTLIATDTDGDGDWDTLNAPAEDTDGNGDPDTDEIAGQVGVDYIFRVSIPNGATPGDTDTLTVAGTTLKVDGDGNTQSDSDSSVTTVSVQVLPTFTVLKMVSVDDGNENDGDDFYIPGERVIYKVVVTNSGQGSPDQDSVTISDTLPDEIDLYVGDYVGGNGGPILVTDGTPGSGLTYSFLGLADGTDSIVFKNSVGVAITPDASGDGFDPAVRSFEITAPGTFNPWSGSGAQPNVTLEYRARIK
ncbi:hypothetical protein [Coraliomargarita akajimensis]|uniref:Uncharacterized protein n=1 Tax=Coraliomargarita akajimensis (strain DSM 45221 / IAM 15411 / JCM 23193 / KCTC 12865 / 04OKA010-24) TaxID=583355 RepID=D5EIR2_CORAD|nr:hypothetical protein [Coraliomargarita akajimensis]ADE54311.1 hypothetical protein Caka_1291 [Coraliomargarita akajimensis DSM 45221]